jgi:erythromycin esterase-like protein
MFETLKELLSCQGSTSKAIVFWAHNSHVGDSVVTEMSARDEYNVRHMCRSDFGHACYAIGFGTHHRPYHTNAPSQILCDRPRRHKILCKSPHAAPQPESRWI